MKLAFAFLAVVGMACAMPAQRSLKNDFDDFLALIPKEKFVELYHKYENDPDIQKVVAYLKSDDFAKVVHIVAGVQEVKELVHYIEDQGVPVIEFLNKLADRLGLPHVPGTYASLPLRSSRSVREFLDEAIALLPLNDIIGLAMDKLANSVAFQELYMKISGVDYQKLHDAALSHPEIVDLIDRVNKLGIDTKKIWETVKTLFGWTYNTRSFYATKGLRDDLNDFLALIPKEKFVELYHKYENDPDIQKIVAYLKSDAFAKVVHIVAGVPEVKELVHYIEDQGVPVIEFLNKLADRLGLPHVPGTYVNLPLRSSRSIRQFLDEAIALLPLNDIIGLAMDKLANSVAFQELYMKISGVDYQKLHDAALSHPEIVDLIDRVNKLGIDTKKIWETVKTLFGWTYNTRSFYATKGLRDDLNDFLALIPKEKFVELYHKYENDPDIQKIVAYLKSDAFAKVVHIVAGVPEVKELVHYIEDQGVPVIEFLNKLADRLGLPHVPGTYASLPLRSSRSIRQFLDEAIALLPLNDIIGLAMDKLANSVAFQELYMKISGLDYQKLHDAALSHPEIVDLIDRVNMMGIDTKKIWETVKTLFGWTYNTRSFYATKGLRDDLNDFLALIPKEKFVELYHKYENDPDIQKIVAYLKSDAFAKVVHIVAGVPEVKELVHYIEDQGVPVIEFLNKLADRLGLPHVPGTYASLPLRSSRSVRQFLDEAIALLPLNDIIALAMDKLANSVAFQELYMKISEVDYQKLHDAALSHPEIVDLINRVNKMGIDTKKIWETVKTLFGWSY